MRKINIPRIAISIYLLLLGFFFLLIGLWPLTPIIPAAFTLAGSVSSFAAILFIFQNERAYEFARRVLRPMLVIGGAAFTILVEVRSVLHHDELSPWPEVVFNLMICVLLGLALGPSFFIRSRPAPHPQKHTRQPPRSGAGEK